MTMADTNTTSTRGVMPRNLQTWVLIGITLLVVVVIALGGTGTKSKPSPVETSSPALGAAPSAPQVPLEQYEARLAQMKADAERAQQEALTAQSLLAAQPPTPPPGMNSLMGAQGSGTGEDDVRKRQVEREYSSLFASQLARSYRGDRPGVSETQHLPSATPPSGAASREADAPRDPRLAELDQLRQSLDTQQQQLLEALRPTPPPPAPAVQPRRASTTARNAEIVDAQRYALLEGSILETTLLTRLNSDFSGPVVAQTSAPLYTKNLQHVLVPAGSRVIGEAKRTEAFGQTRLVVVFHRLLMPDGYSVDLDQFSGISPRGESALSDDVNHHYFRIFGSSIALGMLGGLSSMGASPTNPTTLDQFRLGAASSFGQSATHVLDRFTNILPTITIREGHRVRVWIAQDLTLPAYDAHAMPKDL
jgi:type IV secretion system protein TrbI